MGITQNGIVWITKRGAAFSLCTLNFAIISKIASIAKIWVSMQISRTCRVVLGSHTCIIVLPSRQT